jgi:hypothetical protein
MTSSLDTNRELYLAITRLAGEHKEGKRSLEVFLLALLRKAEAFKARRSLTLAEVHDLISAGFTHDPASFQDAWRHAYDGLPAEEEGYAGWHATLVRQIVDLREMDESGALEDKMRYFGLTSPRVTSWYNFDPCGYVECAMAGSFGGWEPGDATGRSFVPGLVAVLAEDGSMVAVDPATLERRVSVLPEISWDQFKDFLVCGQIYE